MWTIGKKLYYYKRYISEELILEYICEELILVQIYKYRN